MYQSSDDPLSETDFDANQELHKNYFGVGWTKIYIEKMCEFYSRLARTKHTVIRHSNIYGPYDKYDLEKSHVFGATMTKVVQAKENKISVWGTGEEERDLLHVSDIVRFVELVIEKQEDAYQLFTAGYGASVPIKELIAKIIKCSGQELEVEYDLSQPTIKTKLCLDCSKAERVLGWIPQVSLDEGILQTMEWYRENIL
jgi:nucleoside-diphosphate-sugar epimerase